MNEDRDLAGRRSWAGADRGRAEAEGASSGREVSIGMEKLAYSVEEVADLLSLGRTKVVALVSAGDIGSIKVGGRRLVPRRDLHEFVERLRSESLGRVG